MDLYEIDKNLIRVIKEVDFYSLLTPLNREEEKELFFKNLKKGKEYNPVFRYKESILKDKIELLGAIQRSLRTDDDISFLFLKKVEFILTQFELVQCSDEEFTDTAVRLYGKPGKECIDTAKDILLESRRNKYIFPEETVSPEKMEAILTMELQKKNIDWKVVLSRKIVPKITVSSKDKAVYVNANINYTSEEIERLRIHEIYVHVYRGANGYCQPFEIFAEGLAGYDDTEEGLAIVLEETAGCLKIDTRQMKLYAGRALCTSSCLKGSFYNAFMDLSGFFPEDLAYRLVERGKRGLKDTSQKGGFTKGFHYISGWKKVREYIEQGGDISILYVGKIGLEDVDVVKGLLSKGALKEPRYLPEFIDKDRAG